MEWECTECGRTYHEPPGACAICGNEDLVPADADDDRFTVGGVSDRLLDPLSAETSLAEFNAAVNVAFAVLVALSVVLLVVALVLALL